jgi:hypothetical protein
MLVVQLIQSTWRILAAGIFSISLATPTITPTVPASTPTAPSAWSQPVNLSYGWFPDIAADSYGGLHVVWSSGKVIAKTGSIATQPPDEFDVVMYTTNPDGTGWSEPNDIAAMTSGGEATRPSLYIDQNGILHLLYRETSIFYSQAPVVDSVSARAWSPPIIVNESQVAYFSRMAVDSKGLLHLVYTENVPSTKCPVCYHLFYRQSTDNGKTWSIRVDISKGDIGAAKPQILIDKDNNLHVVWESGIGGAYGQLNDPTSVMYANSTDGGKTWSQPYTFPAPNGWGRNVTIGENGRGALIVAWLGLNEDQVYSQTSNDHGKTWSDPQPIPNVWGGWSIYNARLDDYSMATDSNGNVHLVFVGRLSADDKNLEILHLTWDGSTWSSPETITTLTGDVPEWPRLAISLGNQLNVVWFVREQAHIWDAGNSQYKIWYSNDTIHSTALKPNPRPTPAPEAVSTALPSPSPQPTPTPIPPALVAALNSPISNFNIYSEYDNMWMMAKSLVPGIVLLGLVIFFVRSKRR